VAASALLVILLNSIKGMFGIAHNSCELFFFQTLVFKTTLWVKLFFSTHEDVGPDKAENSSLSQLHQKTEKTTPVPLALKNESAGRSCDRRGASRWGHSRRRMAGWS
jgi:hypothetical protein